MKGYILISSYYSIYLYLNNKYDSMTKMKILLVKNVYLL